MGYDTAACFQWFVGLPHVITTSGNCAMRIGCFLFLEGAKSEEQEARDETCRCRVRSGDAYRGCRVRLRDRPEPGASIILFPAIFGRRGARAAFYVGATGAGNAAGDWSAAAALVRPGSGAACAAVRLAASAR